MRCFVKRVFGRLSSINVRKVLWTCSELGLLFQHEECDIDLTASAPMQSGFVFTELNPNAIVPILLDNKFVLWESISSYVTLLIVMEVLDPFWVGFRTRPLV